MAHPLVVYFSAQGNTKRVALALAEVLNAPSYEITPEVPYSAADLNWQNASSRSSVEMHDTNSRPKIADTNAPIADHDCIFLGFPIWWYIAPTIINTFLESYDFSGKTIVLFATSGGSGFGKALAHLTPSAPKASIREGAVFRTSVSKEELANFAKTYCA